MTDDAIHSRSEVEAPLPEQVVVAAVEKTMDEKTDSTTSSVMEPPSSPGEKRKYANNNNRRFSRLFRTVSPSKKSPSKKARMERRRSTGSGTEQDTKAAAPTDRQDDDPPPVPHTVSRSLPFLRRTSSLAGGSGGTENATTDDNTTRTRRRSLFRRGGRQKQQQQSTSSSSSPQSPEKQGQGQQQQPPIAEESQTTSIPWFEQTRVITVQKNSHPQEEEKKDEQLEEEAEQPEEEESSPRLTSSLCTSTEIFQHSYLETLCGGYARGDDSSVHDNEQQPQSRRLPDDPTVQESIECVFSTNLEEDISRMLQLEDDNDDDEDDEMPDISSNNTPVAPSQIQQSVLRTRSDLSRSTPPPQAQQGSRSIKRLESVKLSHVGSFKSDPAASGLSTLAPSEQDSSVTWTKTTTTTPCSCKCEKKPQMDPAFWPQSPLLLRPTPGSGTRVQRIRLVRDDTELAVLWEANGQTASNATQWPQALAKYFGKPATADQQYSAPCQMCPECVVLPINNGNEEKGETIVTDFESDFFEGTLMLRLRHSNGTTRKPYQDDRGYFTGMNRRYQAVIRGRFKKELPLTKCTTGMVLDHPAGKLPSKWILKGAVKVLSFFAPHLEVKFEGSRPMSMTPLGSTPQVLAIHDPEESYDIEGQQEEPKGKEHSLLGEASTASSSLQRARFRKKAFDKLYGQQSTALRTDQAKVYTFEFLQHLFDFQSFSIELGSMLGAVPLAPILNGQALPIMAAYDDFDQRLWSFDVWHESLVTGSGK